VTHFALLGVPLVQSHMREFTLGPLSESQLVPGGRQLVAEAANFSRSVGCYRPNIHLSPGIITS